MSLLIQLTVLIITALQISRADVKHVLEGSAQPPQHVHTYDCQHPQIPGSPNGANWWSDSNSAFRQAYEYFLKCSEKGNCLPPPPNPGCNPSACIPASSNAVPVKYEQNSLDVNRNPFLNGDIPKLPDFGNVKPPNVNALIPELPEKPDYRKNPFLNGQISTLPANNGNPRLDFSNNPFLNGNAPSTSNVSPIIPQPPEAPDFSKNPFLNGGSSQTAFSGNGQAIETGTNGFLGVQPAIPFGKLNTNGNNKQYPTKTKPRLPPIEKLCNGRDEACVAPELCTNGVLNTDGTGIIDRRVSDSNCKNQNKVCCRIPSETYSQTGSTASDSTVTTINDLPSRSSANQLPNILDIKNGKEVVPGSVIKFNGGAGISPGSIQVISDNGDSPNLQVTNKGESGNGLTPSETSDIPVFASTPDFSNDDLSQISFVSTTRGPQYLPPDASPKPIDEIPELVAPSISTYQPFIPTTPRPITKPIIPGPSLVSIHPQIPFIPSPPQPFIPIEPIPNYTPKPPTIEFLPVVPSSPAPFIPQPPVGLIPFPSPPVVQEPFIPQEPVIIPSPPHFPNPEVVQVVQPSTPIVSFENRIKPSEPPRIPFIPKETPGYRYPTPTPPFIYPAPSSPRPSISINDHFVPVKIPRPKPKPTIGYEYNTPTPSFTLPTKRPFIPRPQPSEQFPSFPTPPPVVQVTNSGYLPPFEPINPQPLPSDDYEVKRTSPRIPIPPPTIKVTNQYLPPFEIPEGSNNNEFFVSKSPTVTPSTSNPTHEGQPDIPIPNIIRPPQPPRPIPPRPPQPPQPSLPQSGCAAALKCVQEIYCTAEGVISPVPVILSKAQQLLRVPTTECIDREAGTVGRCCRDPNYVDPWPSANSINGFDDGQYREDPNLGKYNFPQELASNRIQRSQSRGNGVKSTRSRFISEEVKNNTCGVRHFNSQPRSSGPLEVPFAEIPWQAMILRDSTRKLLSGGVIVKPNAVLTSAQYLDGLATNDILIKGGEWKLGIDEEPLPFQIVKVAAIIRHPNYKPGHLQNDLALLILEENLRLAKNIEPICLSNAGELQKQQQCIVTGWGKRILQAHLRGAIMRSIDVNLLDNKECQQVIQQRYKDSLPNYFANTICGYSQNDQCDVDYGSALACTNGNGVYTLAGIFSWDTGCKDNAQLGGYIPPDVEWIEDTCSKPLNQLKAIDRKYNSQY